MGSEAAGVGASGILCVPSVPEDVRWRHLASLLAQILIGFKHGTRDFVIKSQGQKDHCVCHM